MTTCADLKTKAATFLNRSNLTDLLPTFIEMCEQKIAYGDRTGPIPVEPLRVRATEQSSYATFSGQTAALPGNFLAVRRLYIDTTPIRELQFITPDLFWRTYTGSTTGVPTRFTLEGDNIVLGPAPDGSYTGRLLYHKKLQALSSALETNWLLNNAFGVYLSGTLAEAFAYARNTEKAAEQRAIFAGGINALNAADKSDRYASPWHAVTDTGNP